MNGMTILAIGSIMSAVYVVFFLDDDSKGLKEAERRAEHAICQEIAADTLNGVETLATYMQTRCPARYLTEGRDTQPDAAGTAGQTEDQAASGSDDGETTGDGAPANDAHTGDEAGEGAGDTEGTTP